MSYVRSSISDFSLANSYYALATVTVYEADVYGARTTTLAPLYEAVTGASRLSNPQTLTSLGKFTRPVYVDRDVIAVITGRSVATHETGVITTYSFTDYAVDIFTGTGAQTVFTLSRTCATASFLDIVIDGARQQPETAYTVNGTTSLTFIAAPPFGAEIFVVHSATPAPLQPVRIGDGAVTSYDLAFYIPDKPGASMLCVRYAAARLITLPANLTGSVASSGTASTGSSVFTIKKGSTSVGTVTFGAGLSTGVFAMASATSWNPGEVLQLIAPAVQDAALADISISLSGTRAP